MQQLPSPLVVTPTADTCTVVLTARMNLGRCARHMARHSVLVPVRVLPRAARGGPRASLRIPTPTRGGGSAPVAAVVTAAAAALRIRRRIAKPHDLIGFSSDQLLHLSRFLII